jgi:predicted  nucleic acid-binding Zn-ribbon protein
MNDDLVGAGFEKLDPKLLPIQPPKIKWGLLYQDKSDEEKIRFLEKLAASMNHAAALIQDERDKLNELCEKKEQQLMQMAKNVRDNNSMLQQEVTNMNNQRQFYNGEVARLNAEIKKLKV